VNKTGFNKTGFFSHPDCRKHDMGRGHPECPARLSAIADHLLATGLMDVLDPREAPLAQLADLELAHDREYIASLQNLAEGLTQRAACGDPRLSTVDLDTWMNAYSWNAALRAAGAAVAATDAVMADELENAFCSTRPPGHHACRDKAMGFCLINNVAVAALHALEHHKLQRVAIVDFDVHHGNGTENIVAGDERILMLGFYQHPFYPEGGARSQARNLLNLPVPAFTQGAQIRELISTHWLPRLAQFQPEMVFISAGFDAHRDDDLGQLGLLEADYAWMTARIQEVAVRYAQGRIVSCLEGGYHLDALARSVEAHVRVLAGVS
jgi:acetoin utilization deacetylase AcuC-like enzyme